MGAPVIGALGMFTGIAGALGMAGAAGTAGAGGIDGVMGVVAHGVSRMEYPGPRVRQGGQAV